MYFRLEMFPSTAIIGFCILTTCWSFTVNDQFILQLVSLDPDDDLFVEKFLSIRAFETEPAVPYPRPPATPEPEINHRIKEPTHDPELVQILLKVRDDLRRGVLPQPPFIEKHPWRGYHHPLALSPNGFPAEYWLHEGLPHDFQENSEEEDTEEQLKLAEVLLEEENDYYWPEKANQTLDELFAEFSLDPIKSDHNPWDKLLDPSEPVQSIEEWLTLELADQNLSHSPSGIKVNLHPEEELQRASETALNSHSSVNSSTAKPHLSHSLWHSFLSTNPEPPGRIVQAETSQ